MLEESLEKCSVCGEPIEQFKKGVKCKNALITDVAVSYIKMVKHGEREASYVKFEKCNHHNFHKHNKGDR